MSIGTHQNGQLCTPQIGIAVVRVAARNGGSGVPLWAPRHAFNLAKPNGSTHMIRDGKIFGAGRLGEIVTSVKSRGKSSLDGDLCRAIP
jgi:hypothetical protein